MAHARWEYVAGGWRFFWARGGSFIAVWPVDALTNTVPHDMVSLPEWVNVSRLDQEGFETICQMWLRRETVGTPE